LQTKEFIPEELDNDISKDETTYKSQERKFSSCDSAFSYPLDINLFSPVLNKFSLYSDQQLVLDESLFFHQK
jgi:hypothetical protein